MILLLQKNKHMRAQDLSAELEVSLSTIYRDIDALSIAGIPVYTQPGTQGGIFIDEGFRTSLSDLSQNQILSLFLAVDAKSLFDIGMEESTENALLKLFNTLPVSHQQAVERIQERLYIDSESWFDGETTSPYLEVIQQAVWQDQRLQLLYQSYEMSPKHITIDAYALVSKAYGWYLVGRKTTGDYRTYRLTRIIQLQMLDETFERDSAFNLKTYWQEAQHDFRQQVDDDFPKFYVELRIHTSAYWYLIRVLDGRFQQVQPPDEEHWCHVRIQFKTQVEAEAHILAMSTYVEIISPNSLKTKVKQIVDELQHHYGATNSVGKH
ncbi:MAG: WYL domain-containing protein [Chloroflexota bacterium]